MQSAKIRELRQALVASGFPTLGQQAMALGLSRSTAWTVLKGNHKGSGLSATIIKRMAASPQIPAAAKKILLEYIEQKCAGAYGHSKDRVREFQTQIANASGLRVDESQGNQAAMRRPTSAA